MCTLALVFACHNDPAASESNDPYVSTTGTTADPGSSTGAPTTTGTGEPTTDTNASDDSASTADTSFKPMCGDGVIAGDELCDDGNFSEEDGCDLCMPTYTVLWEQIVDGPVHDYDLVYAAATTPAGEVFAAGYQTVATDLTDITVRKFASDGRPLWSQVVDGPAGGRDLATAVDDTPDGGAVVVGQVAIDAEGALTNAWVRRYGPDGATLWTIADDPPIPGRSEANGVLVVDDAVYVIGSEPGATQAFKTIVRRLDLADGAEVWKQEYVAGATLSAVTTDVALAGDTLLVVGAQDVDKRGIEATIQRWTTDGALLSTWTWSDPAWPLASPQTVTTLANGAIAMSMRAYDGTTSEAHLVIFADDGTLISDEPLAQTWATAARGLVTDDDGNLVMVGFGHHPQYGPSSFLGVYAADGSELSFTTMGTAGNNGLIDIERLPTGFAVVGVHGTLETNNDQWIRSLTLP